VHTLELMWMRLTQLVVLFGRHYPKTTATVVAETPELARLAQNTKIQSQVMSVSLSW